MATLAEIRAKPQEQEKSSGGKRDHRGDNAIFPAWNMVTQLLCS